jgi:hypothetical protein
VVLFTPPGLPPSVTVRTGPARYGVDGVTDPAELRSIARAVDAAADWLEAELLDPTPPPLPPPGDQITLGI